MPKSARPGSTPAPSSAPPLVPWIIALVAVSGCIALAFWATGMQGDLDAATDQLERAGVELERLQASASATVTDLSATADGPPLAGGTLYRAETRGGVLVVSGLPAPEDGRIHQLWLLPDNDGVPIPADTFAVDADGIGVVVLAADLPVTRGVGVSLEPTGGSAVPTGPMLVAGATDGPRGRGALRHI